MSGDPGEEGSGLTARFRGRLGAFALDAAFTAPSSGVTALFGPSGCGKTSVLRCIAGLQRVADGFFSVGTAIWQDAATFRPAHARAVGYVFQEASLFPHLSVEKNLMFGAKRSRPIPGRAPIARDDVVALLGLAPLLDRSPARLSGGERQRVAIGRALLSQPALLLMDEPLSALDQPTRQEILPFLEHLHEALSLPVLYVSHDMAEIERLADTLVLMDRGRVVATGPLERLQSDPGLPLFARREATVSLAAVTAGHDRAYGILTLDVPGGRFLVPSPAVPAGTRRRLRIMAGDVSLATRRPEASTILNVLEGRIVEAAETGPHELTVVVGLGRDGDGARLLARVTRRSWDELGLAAGNPVFAQVKGVALVAGGAGRVSATP